jgi:hypothetical protein
MISTIVLGLQLAAMGSHPAVISVQNIPKLDTARSCQAQAAGGLGLPQDKEVCLRSEEAAREQLAKDWTGFAAGDRSTCAGLSTMGGQSTYTELLTCLEMMRDARRLTSKEKDSSREMGTGTVGRGRR